MLLARLLVDVHHPVDELLEAPLALRRADRAAEVLGGDDVGRVDRPEVGELHAVLLEVDRAVPPVGHDDVPALPGDLVVGVHAGAWCGCAASSAGASGLVAWATWVAFPLRVVDAAHRLRHCLSPFRDLFGSLPGPAWPLTLCYLWCCWFRWFRPSGRRFRGRGTGLAVALAQRGDLILEVGERLEALGRPRRTSGRRPRPARGAGRGWPGPPRATAPRRSPRARDRLLHLLGQDRELVLAHRPALAGALHAADDLVPGERLGDAAALGDHQDDRSPGW